MPRYVSYSTSPRRKIPLIRAPRLQKFVTLVASCVFAICSCSSVVSETASLEEITIQQIEFAIASGDAIPAMQDLSALVKVRSIPPERVSEISGEAESVVREQLIDAMDRSDYNRAYVLVRSLEFFGSAETVDSWSGSSVLEAMADDASERGFGLASLIIRFQAAAGEEDRARLLRRIKADGEAFGYPSFVAYASSELLGMGEVGEEVRNVSPAKRNLIDGTVTIWVNRGIRIERGVGYPDAVIGSGFFIDSAGHIITNSHVIESEVDPEYEGYSRLYIRPPNDDSLRIPARVVGFDRVFDLALLKVEMDPDYVFSPSVIESALPGDTIFAIGSPVGLDRTITSGIISATGRRFLQMGDAMQVDVPINPGSSGGPLLDESGELIGVVFAGIEQFEGINFAIPSKWILTSIPRLYLEGEVVYAWLGAAVAPHPRGLEVMYVVPGEPAHRAGIQAADVLLEVAGRSADEIGTTQELLMEFQPGTLIPVRWARERREYSGAVALSSRPDYPVDLALDRDTPESLIPALFGMVLSEAEHTLLGPQYVVRKVVRGSIADETGLSEADPLRVEAFEIDAENRVAIMRIVVQKRKAGFIERAVQIGAYLEIDTFL